MIAPALFRQLVAAIRNRGIRVPDEVRDLKGLTIAVRANAPTPTASPVAMSSAPRPAGARPHNSLTAAEAVTGYRAAGSLRLRHSVANRLLFAVRDMRTGEAAAALKHLGFWVGPNPNRELGLRIFARRGEAVRSGSSVNLSYTADDVPVRFEAVFGRR